MDNLFQLRAEQKEVMHQIIVLEKSLKRDNINETDLKIINNKVVELNKNYFYISKIIKREM